MDHAILKKYMMEFSTEELKRFLGLDLVESLLEWNTGNEAFASKSKGDVEEYIAIPSISKEKISAEIPLVKYLAYEVIKNCSEV